MVLGGLEEPLDVGVEPEDRRAVSRRIAAQPLEDACAVVQSVRENVHFCIVPRDELAVEPDVFGRCEPHGRQYYYRAPPAPPARLPAMLRVSSATCYIRQVLLELGHPI